MDVIQFVKCVLESRIQNFYLEIGSTTYDYKVKNTFCNITEKLNKSLWKSAQVNVPDRNERVLSGIKFGRCRYR